MSLDLPSIMKEANAAIEAERERADKAEKALTLIGEKAVVDWDDPTVGEVDAVVPLGKYKDWVKLVMDKALRTETAEAMMHARIAPFLSISEKTEARLAEALELLDMIKVGMDIDISAPNGDQCDGILLTREYVARVEEFLRKGKT